MGCSRRMRGEKWKAPVIKSLKECERGAHPSKQTLRLDSPGFLSMHPPRSLFTFTCSLLVSPR